jgi:hypothetical protein
MQLLTSFLSFMCGSSDPSAPYLQGIHAYEEGSVACRTARSAWAARLLLESRAFSGGVWSIFIERNPPHHRPLAIRN